MKVSVKNISVEWNGEIKGLDSVMCSVVQVCKDDTTFEEADRLSKGIERLARQLMELAWICRKFAELGIYFGYSLDICIAGNSISITRFSKVEEAPPPLHITHLIGRHSPALLIPRLVFLWISAK
jgi:hypothetical protein